MGEVMSNKESSLAHVSSCMKHHDGLTLLSKNAAGNDSFISIKESCFEGSSLNLSSIKLPEQTFPASSSSAPVTEVKRSWNNLLKEKQVSNLKLEYFPPSEILAGGKYSISPPPEVADEGAKRWEKCAIGFFMGRRMPFLLVKRYAIRHWSNYGLTDFISTGMGVYLLKFKDEEGMMKVLEEETWMIGGQPLFVRKWEKNLSMVAENIKKIAMWVKFYGVPLEYWSLKGFSHIASVLGRPLYVDSVTEEGSRLEFARICVEINVNHDFLEKLELVLPSKERVDIRLEYAWKPLKCKLCNMFGHGNEECKRRVERGEAEKGKYGLYKGKKVSSKEDASDANVGMATSEIQNTAGNNNGNGRLNLMIPRRKLEERKKNVNNSMAKMNNNKFAALATNENIEMTTAQDVGETAVLNESHEELGPSNRLEPTNGASSNSVISRVADLSSVEQMEEILTKDGNSDQELCESPAINHFGGKIKVDEVDFKREKGRILIGWNKATINLNVIVNDGQYIHCEVKLVKENSSIGLTIVYGSNNPMERKVLWRNLINQSHMMQNTPWIIMGDFNTIKNPLEKIGGAPWGNYYCEDLKNCMREAELDDLRFMGHLLTWSNRSEGGRRIACKLDRALINDSWKDVFPNAMAHFLNPFISDHSPCLGGCAFHISDKMGIRVLSLLVRT
ncbi:uncharacterized protein LOC123215472 [Mangifera indica]|uniref:uncharacterized protein LOC123215472 n=1 Tax=Mangifera indica TaxID=29780 RepID=UPI001CFA3D95|nr:uncharacterized protein LOC123215472 [Mangifera indica]